MPCLMGLRMMMAHVEILGAASKSKRATTFLSPFPVNPLTLTITLVAVKKVILPGSVRASLRMMVHASTVASKGMWIATHLKLILIPSKSQPQQERLPEPTRTTSRPMPYLRH